ncbi:unnamed protein product, partial [Larinioides sclopetarius]
MQVLFEIITGCLAKHLLVYSSFLWISCESRNTFGISTRVGSVKGEFVLPHSTWYTGRVVKGNSNSTNNYFRREDTSISNEIWIIIGIFLFIFLMMCIHCATACLEHRRCLSRTADGTSPTGSREDVQTSVGDNDIPLPNY